ncbi:MAG: tetratricopeptide repeat protein [Candidatus Adiutrix sp.]
MVFTFKTNEQGLGSFSPTNEAELTKLNDQLTDIIDTLDTADSPHDAIDSIMALIEKEPKLFQAYAIVGELYTSIEDDQAAFECFTQGYKVGEELIPADYNQPLDAKGDINVQCFLRCSTGYIDSLVSDGEYEKALEVTRRQLVLDEDDIFERGRELSECLILAGQIGEATKRLKQEVETRPEAWYSLAFIAFDKKEYAQAAAYVRHAFVASPYTGDFLRGCLTTANPIWESGPSTFTTEGAMFYTELLGGEVWGTNPEAALFLEWLGQTSTVMADRAQAVTISEKYFKGEDKAALKAAWQKLLEGISPESSQSLVADMCDPNDNETMAPWKLLAKYKENQHGCDDGCDDGCGCGTCDSED